MSTKKISGYPTSRDYHFLLRLMRVASVICTCTYNDAGTRDVARTIYTRTENGVEYFDVSCRGSGYINETTETEFIASCVSAELEFFVPDIQPSQADFVIIVQGKPYRIRLTAPGEYWLLHWHADKKWVTSRRIQTNGEVGVLFAQALKKDMAAVYEAGVPFLYAAPDDTPIGSNATSNDELNGPVDGVSVC